MTTPACHRIGDDHRVEASHDNRTGIVYVRIRRHKRGKPVSFTLEQWAELARVIRAGELDWLIEAALARAQVNRPAELAALIEGARVRVAGRATQEGTTP